MKRLLAVLLLALLSATPARAAPGAHVHVSAIDVGGVRYSIRTVARDATLKHALPGVLVHYTVRCEGRVLPPQDVDGGRLVGCRYGRGALGEYHARPFPDAERPLGWILQVGAICGNTFSHRVRLVTLPMSARKAETYGETTFQAKEPPLVRRVDDTVEVWSTRQDWGGGGTATSIFVPELRIVTADGRIEAGRLPADVRTWPEAKLGRSPRERFVAGVHQANVALLEQVVSRWDNAGDGAHDGFGLPRGRAALTRIVEAVRALERAEARVRDLTRSFR